MDELTLDETVMHLQYAIESLSAIIDEYEKYYGDEELGTLKKARKQMYKTLQELGF